MQEEEHWLRFVQISDIHIVDEESPGRAVLMDNLVASSWRPHEAYSTQILDATLRTINRHHYSGMATGRGPVDFVIVTGDVTDNLQFNEVRWFMDVMDGQWVNPDSGALDGELRNIDAEDNPNLPFKAVGLAKDIPWYSAIGNHDATCLGNFHVVRTSPDPVDWYAPQASVIAGFMGLGAMNPPQTALIPTLDQSPAVLLASEERIDPNTLQLRTDELVAGPIPADDNRHFVSKNRFIEEHFNTTTLPIGHGFDATCRNLGVPRYSVRPKRDVSIRLIVLDSAGPDSVNDSVAASGAITTEQFENFLKPEVKKAQDNKEYVIVFTHHPSRGFTKPVVSPTVPTSVFRSFLAGQPNVIAHFCGHVHYHEVEKISGKYPYLEILTGGVIDYPQEARLIDLFYNREKKTFRLHSQLISHMENPTNLSRIGYERCAIDMIEDPHDYDYTEHVTMPEPQFESLSAKNNLTSEEAEVLAEYFDDSIFAAPSDARKIAGRPATAVTPEQRYGDPEDRDFSFTFSRPEL